MSDQQRLLALQHERDKLQKENERMRKLYTFQGFYTEFFNYLKNCKTHEEAFDLLNEEYFQLFGFYKYKDHQSFKSACKYHLKLNK